MDLTWQEFVKKKVEQFKKTSVINVKDIGRKGRHIFVREAWTFLPQSNLPQKVFIIERLRKEDSEGSLAYGNFNKGQIEYRIGYFIVSQFGKTKGKWLWGQFCPLIPQEDFSRLIDKAKKEGVII